MATIVGDMMVPNGKYIKNGEEKQRWLKIGVLLKTDKGLRGKIECMPTSTADEGGVWFSVFEERENKQTPPKTQAPPSSEGQPTIPF